MAASSADISPTAADLVPFIPRLTLEWLRDNPERDWIEVEGTLAFIDISGFTAMSERLSSRGRAGAEEVTGIMNATFEALLTVAYGEGGGLLKFGGDALLLLYDDVDHAPRAARAAFEMRRTLRAIGRPRTSAGVIQLKMHAGLHSGTFHFFLVGESHRELLVAGPAASRTVEMEAASEAGEILLSPETAALLHPDTLGDEKGPGRLLRAAPDIRGELVPLPDVEGLPIEVAVPTPLRAQLLEVGPLEGEHRHAAIGFLRFSGIDDVIRTEGPEAASDALAVLTRTVQAAADEHQVTVLESDVDRDGGRIILVSGAPQTFGDVEERLLRTMRAVIDGGLPLPVHIGISEGRVFTGQVGASFRRTYTVLGDTAALAARLMARSGEDEVWVASSAFAKGGAGFEATELEPFAVKGKTEPVRAVVLGGLRPETAASDTEEEKLPFVDRERERAVLAASVAPVRLGFGTFVELVGEPGIGKSRLAQELRENCIDMRQVSLRCDQYESSTPYYPFRPFLRSLLDVDLNGGGQHNKSVLAARLEEVDAELVPWAPLLAAPLDVEVETTPEVSDLDPAFWRARLHGVMGTLLGELLDSPTLLVFDDVHWMDDASSELLRYLGTQLSTKPWLTCTTRRPTEGGFAAAEGTPPLPALTLRLEPLPAADARTLAVAAAGDRRLTEEELAALMERGAGNPLFLRELASVGEKTDEAEELPETVEALVATRIDQLAPGDRALLRWASVLGVSFSGSLIAEVLEDDPNVAAGSEAWDRVSEFVERDPNVAGAFRFRHALIRDAAYEGLSYKRRRELHGRVAAVIERRQGDGPEDAAEALSLHFQRAEAWPETWRYSMEAGRRAAEKYANVEAVQFFERALDAVKQVSDVSGDDRARVWESLGDARMRLGQFAAAGDAFREARGATSRGPVEEARLMQREALGSLRLGRYPLALRRLTRAVATLEGIDGHEAAVQRARLYGAYGAVLQHQHRPQLAIEWCEKAIAEAGHRAAARDALANAYRVMDWAYLTLGRLEDAVHLDLAAEIYEELGELDNLAWVTNNLGGLAFLAGRWNDALTYVQRARDAWRKMGDETSASVAQFNMAQLLSDQGRGDEAEPLLRDALNVRRNAGNPLEVALTASALGRLVARAGGFGEARELLNEARTLFEQEGDQVELLTADSRLLETLVLEGESAAALELSLALVERSADLEGVALQVGMLRRLRGWALMQSAALAAAHEELLESLRISQRGDANFGAESADYDAALTLDALVRIGELTGEDTSEYERERDAIFERLGVVSTPKPPLSLRDAETS